MATNRVTLVSFTLYGDNTVTVMKTKTKKRALRARVGDLAIARFDDDLIGLPGCYNEVVCLVVDCCYYGRDNSVREYKFIYWEKTGNRVEIIDGQLTSSRLTRARPKRDDWEGTLSSLTLDNVEVIY